LKKGGPVWNMSPEVPQGVCKPGGSRMQPMEWGPVVLMQPQPR
jgi:hypothetical protein